MMTDAQGPDERASGIDARDPRPRGLRFDDGDRLHRRPCADGRSRASSTTCPAAYDNGANDPEAREKMANAATMAGMAFANAFLGVCHSMAHKLGAFHHLPHGVANALMIDRRHPLQLRGGSRRRWVPSRSTTIRTPCARYAEVADYTGHQGQGRRREAGEPD